MATNARAEPPADERPLDGMRVAVLVAEGVEDLEYWVTVMRLREAGATVTSVGVTRETVTGKNGLHAVADELAEDVTADAVDGLVIPGGWAPDKLRRYGAVTRLVAGVHGANKPIGIICHGGLVAISAGIIERGRRPARSASRTTWSTPAPRGATSPRSATAASSGAASWTTSRRSSGSWWHRSASTTRGARRQRADLVRAPRPQWLASAARYASARTSTGCRSRAPVAAAICHRQVSESHATS